MSNRTISVVIILCILVLVGCAPAGRPGKLEVRVRAQPVARTVVVTESDDGRGVRLAPGDTLVVALPTTPGTGYAWQVTSKLKGVLAQVGSVVNPAKNKRLGAETRERFFFTAIKPGTARLRLAYRRPFERALPAEMFELRAEVGR